MPEDDRFNSRQLQCTTNKQREKKLQSFYDEYGPVARTAFRFAHNAKEYEKEIKSELQGTSLFDIQEGACQSSFGIFDIGLTTKVLHVIPVPDARHFVVSIPTQRLARLVIEELLERTEQDALRIKIGRAHV